MAAPPPSADSSITRLDRAPALEADIVALCGDRWRQGIPLLPAAELYAKRIDKAAEGDGTRLDRARLHPLSR